MIGGRLLTSKRALHVGSVTVVVLISVAALAAVAHPGGARAGEPSAAPGGRWHKESERCMMRRINDFRAARGLPRLDWDRQLSYVARRHAERMADAGLGIWHDPYLASRVTNWRALGENTGRAGGCRELFRVFRDSSEHRDIMLGDWHFVGVGTAWAPGTGLYAEEIFESWSDPGNIYHYPQ